MRNFVIWHHDDIARMVVDLKNEPLTRPLEVKIQPYKVKRSLDQNALYWKWMKQLADHFNTKLENPLTQEDMHDLMRHNFLGYEDKVINKTQINSQLRTTTKLTRTEFMDYMTKIDVWAQANGVLLVHPEDSDYANYKEAS